MLKRPPSKKKVWITYAWTDNDLQNVDFIAQQLDESGIEARLDRYVLSAGTRLWEQIGQQISDPAQSDAWVIVATENSLRSENCREELAYALDRALAQRTGHYPIIGLFLTHISTDLIPPAIRTRLYLTTRDPNWLERLVDAVNGRSPSITAPKLKPYYLQLHNWARNNANDYLVEVGPRIGSSPTAALLVPLREQDCMFRVPSHDFKNAPLAIPANATVAVGPHADW